jgi:hypothetical protein
VPLMGNTVKPAMCLVKRELKELMNKKWAARWVADKRIKQSKIFFSGPESKKSDAIIKRCRSSVGRLIRFILGHAFLRRQSAIVAQGRYPPVGDVSSYSEWDETPAHIILDCPAFGSWRQAVFDVWELPLVNPDWTVMALDKFLSLPDVFLFEDC